MTNETTLLDFFVIIIQMILLSTIWFVITLDFRKRRSASSKEQPIKYDRLDIWYKGSLIFYDEQIQLARKYISSVDPPWGREYWKEWYQYMKKIREECIAKHLEHIQAKENELSAQNTKS